MLTSILITNLIINLVVSLPTSSPSDMDAENNHENAIPRENPAPKHFTVVCRDEWQARSPKDKSALKIPAPFVVIHHSFIPPMCVTRDQCAYAMRTMQSMHMDDRKWSDIGYNFAIGSDGDVYEGRGWETLGAHALHFNTKSIGICLIGNWNDTLPPQNQLDAARELIKEGVRLGYLSEDYKVVGHRQVRPTECPGAVLFEEIRTWPNYDSTDHSAEYYRKQETHLDPLPPTF